VHALPARDLVATAFTLRGAGGLPAALPAGVTTRHRPVPARALQEAWARTELPPVEWLTGKVDVFHATNFVLPPLRKAAGVVTVHDLTYLRYPETVSAASLRYRELVPRSIARAQVVCTPSEAVAAEVRAEYAPQNVIVTPLGVDESWFGVDRPDEAWLRAHGLPPRYLLFVGTLEPRKNLPALLTAYRALRAEHPDTPPLVLIGARGWGPALSTAGLPPEAVITPGYVEQDVLRSAVAGADALVLPSRYEGFGIPPLEAFACGTPVVASDIPVLREVTGGLATLVPLDDSDALAQALHTVDPAGAEKRVAYAREWTWARCAEVTLSAYARALQ
jgi:glycosyltransferase involved in cell wall biosynthesis